MSRIRPDSFNYLFQEDAFSITTFYLKVSRLGHTTRQEADFVIIEIFCMCKCQKAGRADCLHKRAFYSKNYFRHIGYHLKDGNLERNMPVLDSLVSFDVRHWPELHKIYSHIMLMFPAKTGEYQ